MRSINRFRYYSFCFLVFLFVEFAIAVYARDNFVRPFLGDLLVIVLLYCLLSALVALRPSWNLSLGTTKRVVMVLLFAFMIEFLQLAKITTYLGLSQYHLVHLILGSTFDPKDFLAYCLGGISILLMERFTQPWLS